MLKELDVVALTVDRPDMGLRVGQVGTVVFKKDEVTNLVEFSGPDGKTYAMEALPTEQLLKLIREGEPSAEWVA